ncbi:hypothetical protein AAFF_G00344600 [Aldrovandia affinis]|uniref:Uncharacterized protein n=1 Tax=Aldrovandia affinis TaxID=143900 RepID=A0AAD7SKM7_9TELE|nr:hypothetical protein AAFF_G00344600 [Aldrovandia affinis]
MKYGMSLGKHQSHPSATVQLMLNVRNSREKDYTAVTRTTRGVTVARDEVWRNLGWGGTDETDGRRIQETCPVRDSGQVPHK